MPLATSYSGWLQVIKDWIDAAQYSDTQVGYFLSLGQDYLQKNLNSQFMAMATNEIFSLYASYYNSSLPPIDTTPYNGPAFYAVEGQKLYIFLKPGVGDVFQVFYYQKVTQLSNSINSNIFSQYHEEALLYASLAAAAPYMVEDDRIAVWQTQLDNAVASINDVANKAKMGSTPLRRRITTYARAAGGRT
jgi:hypothetical protein